MAFNQGVYAQDGSLRVTEVSNAPGTGGTSLGKAEDAVAADGDTGVAVLIVRKDTPASTAGTTGDYTSPTADASGGTWVALEAGGTAVNFDGITTVYRVLSAAGTTNGANIKNAAGRVYWIRGRNNRASSVFIKTYNLAVSPTVGTSVPIDTFEAIASQPFVLDFPIGVAYSVGIGIAMTTAAADADTGALTAGDITCLSIGYA